MTSTRAVDSSQKANESWAMFVLEVSGLSAQFAAQNYSKRAPSLPFFISSFTCPHTLAPSYLPQHQPVTCAAYPPDNQFTFENIRLEASSAGAAWGGALSAHTSRTCLAPRASYPLASCGPPLGDRPLRPARLLSINWCMDHQVDGSLVEFPAWEASQERPACDSEAHVYDNRTIAITWDTSTTAAAPPSSNSNSPPLPLDEAMSRVPPFPRKWTPASGAGI